jgi:hypothetical protein
MTEEGISGAALAIEGIEPMLGGFALVKSAVTLEVCRQTRWPSNPYDRASRPH